MILTIMKLIKKTAYFAFAAGVLGLASHCASTGEEDAGDEELAADNINNVSNNLESGGNNLGEATNNATLNEFAGDNQPKNLGNQLPANSENPFAAPVNSGGGNNLLGGNAPVNQAPLTNTAPTNEASVPLANGAVNQAPTNAAPVPMNAATMTAPAAGAPGVDLKDVSVDNTHMNWPGRGRVKYVRGTASLHAQPNGPVIGQMVTGDHPLIMREANWAETHDGKYIRATDLSEQGVGRVK